MRFGFQNVLTGLALAGTALVMTSVIVPHLPQLGVESERTGSSQEAAVANPPPALTVSPPERPEGPPADRQEPDVQTEAQPVEPIRPETVPQQEARVPDAVPVEPPAPVTAPAVPDSRVASKEDTPMACLPETLRRILEQTAIRFGHVEVVSTTHLHTENHNAGRAKIHADCMAADIRTPAEPAEVIAFVRTLPGLGGVGTYKNGVIHLDDASAHPPDAYAKRPSATGEGPAEKR